MESTPRNHDTPFIDKLRNGEFQILWEFQVPDNEAQAALEANGAAEQLSSVQDCVDGVFLNSRPHHGIIPNSLKSYFECLAGKCDMPILPTFSGRGKNSDSLDEFIDFIASKGHQLFCAVSGQLCSQNNSSEPFLESTAMLKVINNRKPADIFAGCVVNPCHYLHHDILLTYDKLLKKINAGTNFIIIPVQWDMRKAQELKWFLQAHDKNIPVLAETEFYQKSDVQNFRTRIPENTLISENLLQAMINDLSEDENIMIQNQFKRLAMQIVGYRRLGYSAVIVKGLTTALEMQNLRNVLNDMEAKYPDYEQWQGGWLDKLDGMMTPSIYPGDFLYRNLLCEKQLSTNAHYAPDQHKKQSLSLIDRITIISRKFADGRYGLRPLAKLYSLLFHITPEFLAQIRKTEYLNNSCCPKKLTDGVCGGLKNGRCENKRGGCFFCRVYNSKNNE